MADAARGRRSLSACFSLFATAQGANWAIASPSALTSAHLPSSSKRHQCALYLRERRVHQPVLRPQWRPNLVLTARTAARRPTERNVREQKKTSRWRRRDGRADVGTERLRRRPRRRPEFYRGWRQQGGSHRDRHADQDLRALDRRRKQREQEA